MHFGMIDSHDRKPAVEAYSDLFPKIRTEIGAFEIDDTRCLLQADFPTIVFIAIVRQTLQFWIVGKCFFAYFM